MSDGAEREALRLGVIVLRQLHRGTQRQFGAAARVDKRSVSLYELGRARPSRRTLERLVAAGGLSQARFERLLRELRGAWEEAEAGRAAEESPVPAPRRAGPESGPLAAPTAEGLARLADALVDAHLAEAATAPRTRAVSAPPAAARAAAEPLCRRLLAEVPPACWTLVVEQGEEYQTWAVCERLCEESAQAAAGDASRARRLAEAALLAAERAPVSEPLKSRLLGHAWAFVANSHRVAGDLDAAERGFRRSDELWQAAEPASPCAARPDSSPGPQGVAPALPGPVRRGPGAAGPGARRRRRGGSARPPAAQARSDARISGTLRSGPGKPRARRVLGGS